MPPKKIKYESEIRKRKDKEEIQKLDQYRIDQLKNELNPLIESLKDKTKFAKLWGDVSADTKKKLKIINASSSNLVMAKMKVVPIDGIIKQIEQEVVTDYKTDPVTSKIYKSTNLPIELSGLVSEYIGGETTGPKPKLSDEQKKTNKQTQQFRTTRRQYLRNLLKDPTEKNLKTFNRLLGQYYKKDFFDTNDVEKMRKEYKSVTKMNLELSQYDADTEVEQLDEIDQFYADNQGDFVSSSSDEEQILLFDNKSSSNIKDNHTIKKLQPEKYIPSTKASSSTDFVLLPTAFSINNTMGGGIDSGLVINSNIDNEQYDQPAIYNDQNLALTSINNQVAMNKELNTGVNPEGVQTNAVLIDNTVEQKIEESNEQDNSELYTTAHTIELLSGANRDSLFYAQDLRHQPDLNPTEQLSSYERGLNARHYSDVNINEIPSNARTENDYTIENRFGGPLGSTLRGQIENNSDIVRQHNEGILENINQDLRLMGRQSMYGNDRSLGNDNDFYEGRSIDERMSGIGSYRSSNNIYNGYNPANPLYRPPSDGGGGGGPPSGGGGGGGGMAPPTGSKDELMEQMMFNRGTSSGGAAAGPVGASLQQLRQGNGKDGYKKAGRKVVHDSIAFIKKGKRTDALLDNEFEN